MKKNLQLKAQKLRKEGYSIKELHELLDVSKSSISLWVKDIELSDKAKFRIDSNRTKGQLASEKSIKEKTKQKNIDANAFAKNVLNDNNLSQENTIVLCAMLYQCEGSKGINDYSVTFTNSDPSLIRIFLYLFRKSFELSEEKFRVLMHLHDYHNEQKQKEYWSKVTGISKNQFMKTYNKPTNGVYKKYGYQGCVQVRYYDVSVGRKIRSVAKMFMERYK